MANSNKNRNRCVSVRHLSLGQHFLQDRNILQRIAVAADLSKEDVVLEIGPGLGPLTAEIAPRVRQLICVEKDHSLQGPLQKRFAGFSNIQFHFEDFLALSFDKLRTSEPQIAMTKQKIKVVSNIPYNISSPILFKLLEHRTHISLAVLTLQKEVASRLAAKPGGKDYGIPSVLFQAYTKVEKLFDIKPGAFLPPPKVTSTTIRIHFFSKPLHTIQNHVAWTQLVKTAFGQRRKTLQNNLKTLVPLKKLQEACIQCDLDLQARPEQLSVEQYTKLANCLKNLL